MEDGLSQGGKRQVTSLRQFQTAEEVIQAAFEAGRHLGSSQVIYRLYQL